ncbi:12942_t:CDS:1, partial [Dentiscutata heterogama]
SGHESKIDSFEKLANLATNQFKTLDDHLKNVKAISKAVKDY